MAAARRSFRSSNRPRLEEDDCGRNRGRRTTGGWDRAGPTWRSATSQIERRSEAGGDDFHSSNLVAGGCGGDENRARGREGTEAERGDAIKWRRRILVIDNNGRLMDGREEELTAQKLACA